MTQPKIFIKYLREEKSPNSLVKLLNLNETEEEKS